MTQPADFFKLTHVDINKYTEISNELGELKAKHADLQAENIELKKQAATLLDERDEYKAGLLTVKALIENHSI